MYNCVQNRAYLCNFVLNFHNCASHNQSIACAKFSLSVSIKILLLRKSYVCLLCQDPVGMGERVKVAMKEQTAQRQKMVLALQEALATRINECLQLTDMNAQLTKESTKQNV